MKEFKSGFAGLIGRPNVGKSTLLNTILGTKISIISPKPQTTRDVIQGIYTTESSQIIFVDTPGIHKPKHELGKYMNEISLDVINDVDILLYIIDGTEEFGRGDEFVIEKLKMSSTPCILVVNKIDLIKDENKLEENIDKFKNAYTFLDVIKISAINGENIDKLLSLINDNLEVGPMYYPEDQISDHPENFIISEIIREKVLLLTKEEVPHSVAVFIENKEVDSGNPLLTNINAVIIVERPSQKKIIIGSSGKMIKEIGTKARMELVKVLGTKVYLELFVKVIEDWRNRPGELKKLGYFIDRM
ncbi:MAG: GTPase Era [Bacilli bacterium]|nr:GTPase Era [Bacilli bacterium]